MDKDKLEQFWNEDKVQYLRDQVEDFSLLYKNRDEIFRRVRGEFKTIFKFAPPDFKERFDKFYDEICDQSCTI